MGRGNDITPEERSEIFRLSLEGQTRRQIADQLSRSRPSICKVLNANRKHVPRGKAFHSGRKTKVSDRNLRFACKLIDVKARAGEILSIRKVIKIYTSYS